MTAPNLSRRSTVKDSLTVGMLPPAISKAPTGRPYDSPGQRPGSNVPIRSKAQTGRPFDSPGHRPGYNAPIESGALKGRNMGGTA
jgi:hypothetical protein